MILDDGAAIADDYVDLLAGLCQCPGRKPGRMTTTAANCFAIGTISSTPPPSTAKQRRKLGPCSFYVCDRSEMEGMVCLPRNPCMFLFCDDGII
jgi:hypothetical protein